MDTTAPCRPVAAVVLGIEEELEACRMEAGRPGLEEAVDVAVWIEFCELFVCEVLELPSPPCELVVGESEDLGEVFFFRRALEVFARFALRVFVFEPSEEEREEVACAILGLSPFLVVPALRAVRC